MKPYKHQDKSHKHLREKLCNGNVKFLEITRTTFTVEQIYHYGKANHYEEYTKYCFISWLKLHIDLGQLYECPVRCQCPAAH